MQNLSFTFFGRIIKWFFDHELGLRWGKLKVWKTHLFLKTHRLPRLSFALEGCAHFLNGRNRYGAMYTSITDEYTAYFLWKMKVITNTLFIYRFQNLLARQDHFSSTCIVHIIHRFICMKCDERYKQEKIKAFTLVISDTALIFYQQVLLLEVCEYMAPFKTLIPKPIQSIVKKESIKTALNPLKTPLIWKASKPFEQTKNVFL